MFKKSKITTNTRYIRIAKLSIDDVLKHVFTHEVRYSLRSKGHSYHSKEWKSASKHLYTIIINGKIKVISIPTGSHRYQLFVTKGTKCVNCGIEGKYFAIERGKGDNPNKFHLNLYGINKHGREVMITKDHIIPRSKGGKNILSNYQPMCIHCNQKKADKLI